MTIKDFCQTFGVEIEMKYVLRRDIALLFEEYFNKPFAYLGGTYDKFVIHDDKDRDWQIVSDSSLHDGNKGCEIVSPILSWDDLPLLQRVVDLIAVSSNATIDQECGIHVHVANSLFSPKSLRNLQNLIYIIEPLLFQMLNVFPDRANLYCKMSDSNFVSKLNSRKPRSFRTLSNIWYSSQFNSKPRNNHYNETRYHNLNLHSFFNKNTVEFRMFNGSLDPLTVSSYVILSLALCNFSCKKNLSVNLDSSLLKGDDTLSQATSLLTKIGINPDDFPIHYSILLSSVK